MVEHIRDEECDVGVAHVLASVPADLMVVILQPLVAGCVPQLREPLAQREEGRTAGTIPSLQKTPSTCGSPSRARPVRGSRRTDRLRPVSRYWPFAAVPGYQTHAECPRDDRGLLRCRLRGAGHGASTTCAGREPGYHWVLFHRDGSTRVRLSTVGYKAHNSSSTERKGRIPKPRLLRCVPDSQLPHTTPLKIRVRLNGAGHEPAKGQEPHDRAVCIVNQIPG